MSHLKMVESDRIAVLLVEYEQLREHSRAHMQILMSSSVAYLAIIGVATAYGFRGEGLSLSLLLAGLFSILVSLCGLLALGVAQSDMRRRSTRMETVCALLEIEYGGELSF